MNVIRRRGWEIPERLATPEHLVFNRRSLLAAGIGAGALALAPGLADAAIPGWKSDPTPDLYPAKRNPKYKLDRPITDQQINTTTTISTNSAPPSTLRRPRRHCRSGRGR